MKNLKFKKVIIILFLGMSILHSQNAEIVSISIEKEQLLDQISNSLISIANLPGVSIAIKKDDDIVFAKAYGYSDIEEYKSLNIDTRMRTASVAKVMTVTALGKLVSEGRLDLDAPISNYIAGLSKEYGRITSRQLAGHLGGVRHRPRKKVKNKLYSSIDESLDLFKKSKLAHVPGSKYKYSTNGYTLLSGVIEGAAGMSYLNYMDVEIFSVLGMSNSRPEIRGLLDMDDASLYYHKDEKLRKERKLENASYKWAGAGYRTTPTDLVIMMQAYTNGMIKEKVVDDLFTSLQLEDGTKTQVGVGWRTHVDPFGRKWMDHAGNWQGARSVLAYFPEENLSVSIMVNCSWNGFIEETAQMIGTIILNEKRGQRSPVLDSDNVEAIFTNFDNAQTAYRGTLKIKDGVGTLNCTPTGGFMEHIELFYLGFDDYYAGVTDYGVMYMQINQNEKTGELYMYSSMRDESPILGRPTVSFKY